MEKKIYPQDKCFLWDKKLACEHFRRKVTF